MKKIRLSLFFILLSCTLLSQTKSSYQIGFLLDYHTEQLKPLFNKLKNQIKAVVGEDAIIVFSDQNTLINNFSLEKAKENYQKLLQNNTDIIIAFGVVNNEIISKQKLHKKPTVLFGAINQDISNINLDKNKSGIKNFTYLIEKESYTEDLQNLKKLTGFKNVGIAIEKQVVDILPLKNTFDKVLKNIGGTYKLIPFKNVSDITSNLDGIDALYVAGGFFFKQEEIKQLAKELITKKLPSFTLNGTHQVKDGLMATNQSEDNFEQFFRRISLTIESYINGTPLSELPVFIDYNSRLTINYNTAELVGVPIKNSLIATTDFVGEFKNSLSKKQYNLTDVVNEVLGKNLTLKSSKKDIEISQQNVKTAKSSYLPNLTASANATYVDPDLAEISSGQNPEYSTSGNLTLQQTLYSASASTNIKVQENLKKAQEESYNTDELNTVFNAANAYFNTLVLKTNTQIQIRNLELTKKNLQIANQNYEAGEQGKTDVLRFRSQMAQDTQSLVESINQLEQGFVSLNQLLNNPVNYEIDVDDVELGKGIFKEYNYDLIANVLDDPTQREPFIDFLTEEAKKNAPELKSLGYNLKATEKTIKLNSSGRFLPTVALQGQYNRTFTQRGVGSTYPVGFAIPKDGNYNATVNVSIPIFNSTQTNINRQTAIIQKEQLEINKENTTLNIEANIRNGVLNLVNQMSNIELSKISEAAAKESLDLTQTAYSSGAVNIIQLIDAQNNYLNTQLAKSNATYNYLINALQLERYLGFYFLLKTEAERDKFTQRFFTFLNSKK